MGIFQRKTASAKQTDQKTSKKPAEVKDEVLTPSSQQTAKDDKQIASMAAKGQAGTSYRLLRSPRVSEKAAILASKNIYVFNVPVEAEKIEIAKAVKDLYGVSVIAVRTLRGIGKRYTRGRVRGQRNRWKKAYVEVKSGQKIDLYEGV